MHPKIEQPQLINKKFRLYDETIFFIAIGLVFLTYKAFVPERSFEQKLYALPFVIFTWVTTLFKIHWIEIKDSTTINFHGIVRKIQVTPKDILSVQDWLRGVRITLPGRSIILWPFIEKQGEFKTLLNILNPAIELKDISNEATKSSSRIALILLGLIIYFGLLIWFLFYNITRNL